MNSSSNHATSNLIPLALQPGGRELPTSGKNGAADRSAPHIKGVNMDRLTVDNRDMAAVVAYLEARVEALKRENEQLRRLIMADIESHRPIRPPCIIRPLRVVV